MDHLKHCLFIKLQLHGAIYRNVSFVLMLRYRENLKTIRYESTTSNRIVADKLHRVIVALVNRSPFKVLKSDWVQDWANFDPFCKASINVILLGAYKPDLYSRISRADKATITQCDLLPRFFCRWCLCEFESDKIWINDFEQNRRR